MTPKELAELYVIGQAAALVSAVGAISKSEEAKYKEAQNKRVENATAVLKKIPEAAGLLAAPSRENALKMSQAISGKDLTGVVGDMLPAKSDYK